MELLAPAGSKEQLIAALEAGADAIYMGGKLFSARKYAANFTEEEMIDAVKMCHVLGVPVYITLNTLIADSEWDALREYLKFLDSLRIDGLLVQDIGVAREVRELAPDIPLHASTQMTVSNLDGVNFLKNLNFKRAVLSRELSLKEIRQIASQTDMEIEVFVHGALCVCYSGQCLMSSFIGGRSGNRGACAQPCRLPYDLVNAKGHVFSEDCGPYLLSLKDMTGLDRLRELREAGVASLKIEGRMKSPDYVYAVVSSYRTAINALQKGKETDEESLFRGMKEYFNRGYTHGYYDHTESRAMITEFAPGNHGIPAGKVMRVRGKTFLFSAEAVHESGEITGISYITEARNMAFLPADKIQKKDTYFEAACERKPIKNTPVFWHLKKAEQRFSLKEMKRKIPVFFQLSAVPGKQITLSFADADGHEGTVLSEYIAEKAVSRVTEDAVIRKQLSRLGNTLFRLEKAEIRNEGCMTPQSVLNHLRQDAVQYLETQREESVFRRRPVAEETSVWKAAAVRPGRESMELAVRTDSVEQALSAMSGGAGRIIFGGESFLHKKIPLRDYQTVLERGRALGIPVVFSSPRVVREENLSACRSEFIRLGQLRPDAMEIQFPGARLWAEALPESVALEGGPSLNIFNGQAIKEAADWGLSFVWLSQELTLNQIRNITALGIPAGAVVYGRTEMMISEYCVINSVLGGTDKTHCRAPCMKDRYFLKDQRNRLFPVRTDEWCHMHILNSEILDMRPYMGSLVRAGLRRFCIDVRGTDEDAGTLCRSFAEAIKNPASVQNKESGTRGHFFRGILQDSHPARNGADSQNTKR